jgi:hypothetical protein
MFSPPVGAGPAEVGELGARDDVVDVVDVVDEELDVVSSAVELLGLVELAVFESSLSPNSSHRATPTAASTTTPATMRAITVFLLPFGG